MLRGRGDKSVDFENDDCDAGGRSIQELEMLLLSRVGRLERAAHDTPSPLGLEK